MRPLVYPWSTLRRREILPVPDSLGRADRPWGSSVPRRSQPCALAGSGSTVSQADGAKKRKKKKGEQEDKKEEISREKEKKKGGRVMKGQNLTRRIVGSETSKVLPPDDSAQLHTAPSKVSPQGGQAGDFEGWLSQAACGERRCP